MFWFLELEEELGSSENRWSWRIDVSLFVELEEEMALFRQNHSLPGNGGGVAPIFILGGELLALMPVLFWQNS